MKFKKLVQLTDKMTLEDLDKQLKAKRLLKAKVEEDLKDLVIAEFKLKYPKIANAEGKDILYKPDDVTTYKGILELKYVMFECIAQIRLYKKDGSLSNRYKNIHCPENIEVIN